MAAPASAYVLHEGRAVTTYGIVSTDGDRTGLSVTAALDLPEVRRLPDATVALTGLSDRPHADPVVRVSGTWTPAGIAVEQVEPVTSFHPPRSVQAPESSLAAVAGMSRDQMTETLAAGEAHADGLALSSGRAGGGLYLVVLHVSPALAAWHEAGGRQLVTLLPLITPSR